ncbi:P-type DNA transfer ATPase VirB11 [Aliarcobacter trophiarum LMG 25534]|uniref:P-type DNA transfer ATPase VirB11 n=1 Tax=Aliarcobacter trophiarum LMG 25534 TaxID=1032241 RepID=A0AAD0QIY9_9BACT|nr:P-type DNA transfer ATPase VirB11 [Aliarcobacter trophiarum]AXK48599.1 P-type type IV conjugative transfer system ATPase TrbB/VirB11 [Aliarcobacter trophiarum LMG 25534]RXJ91070.1 P-type DNA transfer ATPase VirB11 [Aliarcobacter trophiarum LMG 25534]
MNKDTENKSRSLEIKTKQLFSKYLEDDSINEICFNGDGSIWTQNSQGIWSEDKREISNSEMMSFGTPLASFKEDVLKANKPILSASLNDGERVQVIISPATKKGKVSVTIRKPSKVRYTFEDFKKQGLIKDYNYVYDPNFSDEQLLEASFKKEDWAIFLPLAVKYGLNLVIAGATGSGKTTFMKSLIDFIPLEERLITIEDTEEITFHNHKNFVQLFYPSEAKEGDPVTSATLLKSCLRMKPDRILLAELRGGETYDYLNVLNSGHGGSITSIHANSSKGAFTRLALMILQNPQGQKLPYEIIEKNLKDVIDVVIHIKCKNGVRYFSKGYYRGIENEKSE